MRKFLSALLIGFSLAALSGAASARVDVGLYFGAPAPVYVPRPPVAYYPPPVYVAPPPPVYVAPAPVYYGPPAYYAPRPYYAPRVYYRGGWDRGWHGHRRW